MTFDVPAEIYAREGQVRCNVHAKSSDEVAPLVSFLESRGYITQHSLAEQQGLKELGRVLVGLVGVLVLGTVLGASLTVLITTMMNIQSKIREIGILRTQGAGSRDILGIFGIQGLLIGVAAFALGSAIVILGEPLLRSRIGTAFNLPMAEIVTSSLGSHATWWLFALALGVAVFFSLVGVFFPALLASHKPLVEALRHRE
jgi:lipoprotein-releasing system permease protein